MSRRHLFVIVCALAAAACVPQPSSAPAPQPAAAPAPAGAAAQGNCAGVPPPPAQRPFSAEAPWNVPVCRLAEHPQSRSWAERFWLYSNYNDRLGSDPARGTWVGRHGVEFGFDEDPLTDFSVAVYDAREATGSIRVFQRGGWAGAMNVGNGGSIPWNPAWRASTGSDAMLAILDPATGREWGLWGVVQSARGVVANDSECWGWSVVPPIGVAPYVSGVDLCVGSANLMQNASGSGPSDRRSYGGNAPGMRGVGIQGTAMLLTPDDVEAGVVGHALALPVYNTMNTPACTEAESSGPAFGVTCGRAVAPAGNFEAAGYGSIGKPQGCGLPIAATMDPTQYRQTTVPEGMRFALRMSDGEIEQWLDSRGFTGVQRETARVIAEALVDYGWFITDTTCGAANFQAAGAANPATAARWRALGVTGTGQGLLDGLIRGDRVWTVEVPLNRCVDGSTSRFDCPAERSTYE